MIRVVSRKSEHRNRAERFAGARLLDAVRAECEVIFERRFGRPWDAAMHRRFAISQAAIDLERDAVELMEAHAASLSALSTWCEAAEGTSSNDFLAVSRLLFNWVRKSADIRAEFPEVDAKLARARRIDSRSWLIQRLLSGQPNPFFKVMPRDGLKVRDLSVVSVLAGKLPKLDASKEYTVREVLDLEDRYMRKYRAELARPLGTSRSGEDR